MQPQLTVADESSCGISLSPCLLLHFWNLREHACNVLLQDLKGWVEQSILFV